MFKRVFCVVIVVLIFLGGLGVKGTGKALPGKVRVGVFDSRAVAIAYAQSKYNSEILSAKKAELEKAKADGDSEKVTELEKWGPAHQAKLHRQGFGCASVRDLLKHIEGDIPEIAKKAEVDVIVSKWDVAYKEASVEFVDVTDLIVRPFEPDQRALNSIKAIGDHEPVSDEVLDKMHCGHSGKKK